MTHFDRLFPLEQSQVSGIVVSSLPCHPVFLDYGRCSDHASCPADSFQGKLVTPLVSELVHFHHVRMFQNLGYPQRAILSFIIAEVSIELE